MAGITLLSNGALHPDLLKNSFIKYVGPQNQTASAAGQTGARLSLDPEELEQKAKEFTETLHRNGAISLDQVTGTRTDTYVPSASADSGKTIIDNRADCGLIIGTIQHGVTTPSDANKSAAAGGATHGFFFHTTDFLMDAAEKYATLGENEEFLFRGINDVNFVRDTLDFFTDGNYTAGQVSEMQNQITSIVQELAQQIKNGDTPDIDKVQTKLSVAGVEVSLSALLDMQKAGRELSQSFEGFSFGSLGANNIQNFAEMGISRAFANLYGENHGVFGTMFSDAMNRLYDKGISKIENASRWVEQYGISNGSSAAHHEAVQLEFEIADLFAGMDVENFSDTLSQMRNLVEQYCKQNGLTTSYVGLAGATVGVEAFFQKGMELYGG